MPVVTMLYTKLVLPNCYSRSKLKKVFVPQGMTVVSISTSICVGFLVLWFFNLIWEENYEQGAQFRQCNNQIKIRISNGTTFFKLAFADSKKINIAVISDFIGCAKYNISH